MVNAKGVAFKVNKQTPISKAPLQAYGTVINCRKPAGKRAKAQQKELQSHYVAFTNIEGTLKRKRGEEQVIGPDGTSAFSVSGYQGLDAASSSSSTTSSGVPTQVQQGQAPPKLKFRRLKGPSKGVDMDCWYIILSYADPAQLLVLRSKIPSCFYYLRENPMLWKLSRNHYYGDDLPEPPSELTEFQYADLRHHHGCQSANCKTPNTRKTYWAFVRRWCKTCLQDKTVKEHDAVTKVRDAHGGEETLMLLKCLPAGIFDSWGNFVGVGPATTHALKTVYLKRDVDRLIKEYSELKAGFESRNQNSEPATSWADELAVWLKPKMELAEERKAFAHRMEAWEETLRNNRSYEYSAKKAARKTFYQKKASELSPAISVREMECCPSYKRAVAIPKQPNNNSWLQLKPKLEKEAAELKDKGGPSEDRIQASSSSVSRTSTPSSVMEPSLPHRFSPAFPTRLGFYSQRHMQQGLQQQSHIQSGPSRPPPAPAPTLPTLPPLPSLPPLPPLPPRPPPPQSHPFPTLQNLVASAPPRPPQSHRHPGFPPSY